MPEQLPIKIAKQMANTNHTDFMNEWLLFLTEQGATIIDGLATAFGESPADYPALKVTLTDLGDQGVLALKGIDSKRFLQGQSTSDTSQLDEHTSLPGAICNPKGRMLTSYQALEPVTDSVLLVMHRSLVDTTINNVGKYAAFFKTSLSNASDEYRLFGISGPDCEAALESCFDVKPTAINQIVISGDCLLLRIATQQLLVIVTTGAAEALWLKLASTCTPTGISYWHLQSIQAGLAQVRAETFEQFVPQMFNLQATGAVNFKKGCYTGQEIVARMQYLGKLKRRTYRVIIDDSNPPDAGTEIYASETNKLVGSVLMAAPANEKNTEMLAVLHEEQADASSFVINGEAVKVSIAELPYPLTSS